jgi:flagellin-like protein
MKRIWNIKKKSGVSPVIATILMVAITVVLAAVLYVMVMNMSSGPNKTAPQVQMYADRVNSQNVTITFSSCNPATAITQFTLYVENTDTGTKNATVTWTTSGTNGTNALAPTSTIDWVGYYDIANNNVVNMGDTIVLHFATAGAGTAHFKASLAWTWGNGDVVAYVTFMN